MVVVNFLLTPLGEYFSTSGTTHEVYIRRKSGPTLKSFLRSGGVRVKTHNDHMAIEAGRPLTAKQKRWIRSALKGHDYFSVVTSIGGKYASKEQFVRPIRSV